MGLLAMNCWWKSKTVPSITSGKFSGCSEFATPRGIFHVKVCSEKFQAEIRAFAGRNSMKGSKSEQRASKDLKSQSIKKSVGEVIELAEKPPNSAGDGHGEDSGKVQFLENLAPNNPVIIPSRDTVLKACVVTSGLIAAIGIIIRQVSYVASTEEWPILDCSAEVSFGFEIWHLELIAGLVVLVSSCRYVLLKTWPDFSESSEAANQQVLSSLEPLDYIVVAFLTGISEELLFRGALLPLIGVNWKSALGVALLFGFLHFGSGRKLSFAVWATMVGFLYGYATIVSSSVLVPMASHAVNNLIGGLIWRYGSYSATKKS